MENGKEIRRFRIQNVYNRPDVQNYVGEAIYGAHQSGFGVEGSIEGLSGRTVQIMHRFTNDPGGDTLISDYIFTGNFTL